MNRIFHKGEKPHDIFNHNTGVHKFNKYFYLRIGRIVEIDYDKYKYKVEWITGSGSPAWIQMSFPYVGPGSCLGGMPEYGALVLCHYQDEGNGKGTPHALAFLPVSIQAGLEHNALKQFPDSIPTEEDNLFFVKFRKLQKGDMIMSSLWGGEIFVNRDVEIKDGQRDHILIRSSDQSIIATSLNNFIFSNGVAIKAGPVIRNKVNIFDTQGNRIPNQLAREAILPDGRQNIYIVPYGGPIQENSQFFTEYRIEAAELGNGTLESNDINSQTSLSNRNSIVALSMGNYVGSVDTKNNYGKILRPVLFSSINDSEGHFNLTECVQNKGMDEVSKLGMAYAVHLLKNDALIAMDKEGHFYLNLNASSSANPLGAGRSMSIRGSGNLKEIWGQAAEDGNSWDLSTKGGIVWDIGKNNAVGLEKSIDIKTSSSVSLDVRGSSTFDNDTDLEAATGSPVTGFSRVENILGNQKVTIGGSEKTQVNGASLLQVDGLRQESITGAASYSYEKDKTENCLGVYTQVVIKEMQGRFGKRKETVLLGQTLEIMTGDMVETIKTFGSKKTTLTLGNIEETIIAGNKKINIVAGNYSLSIVAGNIDIKTIAGQLKMTSTLGATISGGVSTKVNGLTVSLGTLPIKGGVVTGFPGIPSHFDYVTGLPLVGSLTVKASR